jgi:Tol biopolymer transport system component
VAYTLWNPHTDRPDIYIWDLAARIHNTPIANFRQPDFSPQGGLVANAQGAGMDNLVQMGLYGENPWVISAHPEDAHPHWSADGKKLVYDSAHMGDRQYRLYLQNDLTQREDQPPMMYEAWELFGRYPIFLADGRIAYNGCNYWQNGGICGVYVVNTEGGMPSNATGWPGDIPTDNLGSRILFMSDRSGNWDIYSMNPDGSGLVQLTDLPGVDGLATASPDGNNIAFLTDRDGVWSLYVMRPDGSEVRKLLDLPGNFGRGEYDWFQERISWGR